MKAVILAGGLGTRLSEETALRPKPMVEIGGMPIFSKYIRTTASMSLSFVVVIKAISSRNILLIIFYINRILLLIWQIMRCTYTKNALNLGKLLL